MRMSTRLATLGTIAVSVMASSLCQVSQAVETVDSLLAWFAWTCSVFPT